jgi:hypothetical protein
LRIAQDHPGDLALTDSGVRVAVRGRSQVEVEPVLGRLRWTARAPKTIAPRTLVVARNAPRTTTQNSLPSGSASTTCSASAGCPPSIGCAPTEVDPLTRSRWIGFFSVSHRSA